MVSASSLLCMDFSLAAVSGGLLLVGHRRPTVEAPAVAEHVLQAHGLQ